MRIVVATIIILASLYSTDAVAGSGRTYLGSSRYSSASAYYERSRDQNFDYSYSSPVRISGGGKPKYQYSSTQYASPPSMQLYNNPAPASETQMPYPSLKQPSYAPMTGGQQASSQPLEQSYVPQAPVASSGYVPPPQAQYTQSTSMAPPPPVASAPPPPMPEQQLSYNAQLPPPSVGGSRVEPYSSYKQASQQSGDGDIFSGSGIKASVGLGAGVINQFEGSGDYQWLPIPYFDISYNDRVFFSALQGIGLHLYKSDNFQFTTALGYRMGRDGGDTRMGFRGDIDAAFEGSMMFAYFVPTSSSSRFKMYGEFIGDLSGTYDGYLMRAGLGYTTPLSNRLMLTLDGYSTYASQDYMQTYFGVTALQAMASGYSVYTPESGFKDIGVSATTSWAFDDKWSLLGLFGYKRLLGDAADSPIVEDGSADMLTFGTAVVYTF